MKLIADSGSTSTDWIILNETNKISFKTIGMNPYFITPSDILVELNAKFPHSVSKNKIKEIYFYGTGCKAQDSKNKISSILQSIFTEAEITIKTDLEGAAIAAYGNKSGIISILGTGMNVGIWNGKSITKTIQSLGFILGDEGSGADIGKHVLKAILENKINQDIVDDFHQTFALDLSQIIQKIYSEKFPNKFLASLMPFVYKHSTNKTINKIIQERFEKFIVKHLLFLSKNYELYDISVIGSVAYFFKEILSKKCKEHKITITNIIANPIEELSLYHLKYDNRSK